jgi:hypothetical protein
MNYNNNSRSLNNTYKYKLVKANNIQPLANQNNTLNTSTKTEFFSDIPYNKSISPISVSSSFKIDNSSSLILNKTLESSNKLDDLLKRCREIGSSETKINNEHRNIKTTSPDPSFIGKNEI